MNLSKQPSETLVTKTTHEFFAPATIKPLFWRPRFRTNSLVQLHAPMLLWLAADARAQNVGVLGVGDGFAHFLFCQAIDKLNFQGCCSGFGFWKEPKSGASQAQVPLSLSEHAEQFYEDISRIKACLNTTEAVENMVEKSLDLLFVDLSSLTEGDYPHLEDLIRLMRSSAILIVHGTNSLRQGADNSVALAKQLGRLDRLEFSNGAGLSVFPIGEEQPTRLKSLMATRENGEVPGDIQLVFRRLGQSLAAFEETRTLKLKIDESTKALFKAEDDLKSTKRELTDLREAYDQRSRKVSESHSLIFDLQTNLTSVSEEKLKIEKSMLAAESALDSAQAELKSQGEELKAAQAATREAETRAVAAESALDSAQAELKSQGEELKAAQAATREAETRAVAAESALDSAQAELKSQGEELKAAQAATREAETRAVAAESALESIQAELKSQGEELKAAQDELLTVSKNCKTELERATQLEMQFKTEKRALEMEKKTRFEETAALTRLLETARVEVKTAEEGCKTELERVAQLELKLNEASATIEALNFQNAELLNSTSWKVTAPIRKVKTAFSKDI